MPDVHIHTFIAIDPGNGCTGVALFRAGLLRGAWALTADIEPGPCAACPLCRNAKGCEHRVLRPASLVRAVLSIMPCDLPEVDAVAIERPAWWRGSTPNAPALLALADLAGALQGAVLAAGVPLVLAYEPRIWKGTADKPKHQRETLAALTETERGRLPRRPRTGRFQPDALDAAGLGLFLLRRSGRFLADPAAFAEQVEAAPARGRKRKVPAPPQGGLPLFASSKGKP